VPDHITELLQGHEIWVVDGDTISRTYLGRTIANTVMLGALIKVTELVSMDNLTEVLLKKFSGDMGTKNMEAINAAFNEVTRYG
jgi:pyruvate ferredoxin oxidoreductase gamma subunit